jgi:hypothetical protein
MTVLDSIRRHSTNSLNSPQHRNQASDHQPVPQFSAKHSIQSLNSSKYPHQLSFKPTSRDCCESSSDSFHCCSRSSLGRGPRLGELETMRRLSDGITSSSSLATAVTSKACTTHPHSYMSGHFLMPRQLFRLGHN